MSTTLCHIDKIASSARHAGITRQVKVGRDIVARRGYVLAVKVLNDKVTYDRMEIATGRMVKVRRDDILAVTLGARHASKGFAGFVPESIAVGDRLQILNMGGICGVCTAFHPEFGQPFDVEVLGAVLSYPSMDARIGVPAHTLEGPIKPADHCNASTPVIYVSGTAMNAGKTFAACELIREFVRAGRTVAACKISGVSLMRDTLNMTDAGAAAAADFTDAGSPITDPSEAPSISLGVIGSLARQKPDVIVAELGDGLLGQYGVSEILENGELMSLAVAHVVCASDPVGAYGAHLLFRDRFSQPITVISGPVSDNQVGRRQIEETLGVPAINAFQDAGALGELLAKEVDDWKKN